MLTEELAQHIEKQEDEIRELRSRMTLIRSEIARQLDEIGDSLRLYRSLTGSPHPAQVRLGMIPDSTRTMPRVEQVLAVLDRAAVPMTLTDLVTSLPDAPERGAITAAIHRAVKRGVVVRVERGLYASTRPDKVEVADTAHPQ